MSLITKHRLTQAEADERPEDIHTILSTHPASAKSVEFILAQSEEGMDGRSNWVWIRLMNGDLMLATFPQGDAYFTVEEDAQYPD